MNQIPQKLYTKCPRYDLQQVKHTLGDTGIFSKFFFEDPFDPRLQKNLSKEEVIIGVAREGFVGDNIMFAKKAPGVWENKSPILMRDVFI
jgi:hypothetical protein